VRDPTFALGLDFGTGSVRALLVDTRNGDEIATATFAWPTGDGGVLTSGADPNLARQHPGDWLVGCVQTVQSVVQQAKGKAGFLPERIVGIGVDTTGSTPLPVDQDLVPLALHDEFRGDLAAQAWLWKDHTAYAEAAEITAAITAQRLPFLGKCGGTYSSEWFWAKVLRCERAHPRVAKAAAAWLEACDFVPAWLCGVRDPGAAVRSVCAAAHKGLYHPAWGGLPATPFLAALAPGLARIRERFAMPARASNHVAGRLHPDRARVFGLPPGLPVAVGALDAHYGAVGSGVGPGTLVKILGTSTCDCMVAPLAQTLPDIPGLCGIAPESILPGMHGLEAGQSAVGDIFQWFVKRIAPHGFGSGDAMHQGLAAAASKLRPGESGLVALDWHNGNRTVLVDPQLTGLLVGETLHTTPPELYRALIEATAFGARKILDRLAEYGVAVERIVTCGGLAEKNPLLLQIYADVAARPMLVARSEQACALGAAVFGAVVGGAHPDAAAAQRAMTGTKDKVWRPDPAAVAVYERLYGVYGRLHDAFGLAGTAGRCDLHAVMKDLLAIRAAARA
jgi:L-ribulokinase